MPSKKTFILLGIVFGLGVLSVLGFTTYKTPQAKVELHEKVNDALARAVKRQVLTATEIYYDNKKTVPLKLSDLVSYLPQNTPGLELIEYHYIDSKNADVCLIFDSLIEQRCQRFAGQ